MNILEGLKLLHDMESEDSYEYKSSLTPEELLKELHTISATKLILQEDDETMSKIEVLTKEAKIEAKEAGFNANVYKKILILLKSDDYQQLKSTIIRTLRDEYTRQDSAKKLSSTIRGNNNEAEFGLAINRLAASYEHNKSSMNHEKLLLLNPKTFEEEHSQITAATTFVHSLFENGASKDSILYFFNKLNELSRANFELINNYLSLSDENGKSILQILEEQSLKEKYTEIIKEVKSSCKSLFPNSIKTNLNSNLAVDVHTGSIHSSVDKSFTQLADIYDKKYSSQDAEGQNSVTVKKDERSVHIDRTAEWHRRIQNSIDNFMTQLSDITTNDESIGNFITPTLAKGEEANLAVDEFKFKAQTALRMLRGLSENSYGKHYTVLSNEPLTCGLTPKEVVAIAYDSLEDTALWSNPELRALHFMQLVDNLYIAKRGYNIDNHGHDEWKTPMEDDKNKCTGGTINQIAYGLVDHTKVEVHIITSETMKPILSKTLERILPKIIDEDPSCVNLVMQWINSLIISPSLSQKIITYLKQDEEFSKEFNEGEINHIGLQVLNQIKRIELEKIKQYLHLMQNTASISEYELVNSFVLDNNKGYILYLEYLYNKDKETFNNILKQKLDADIFISKNPYSNDVQKMSFLLSLLFTSNDKSMSDATKQIFLDGMAAKFSEQEKNDYFLAFAERNERPGLMITLVESGIINLNAKDRRTGHNGNTALHYAAIRKDTEVIEALAKAGADINAKNDNGETAGLSHQKFLFN